MTDGAAAPASGGFAVDLPVYAGPFRLLAELIVEQKVDVCDVAVATVTDRYLARLIAAPLIGTLLIAAMLLILDKMLRLFDFVASEGGPVSVVWRMLANLIPEYLSLGIPIGFGVILFAVALTGIYVHRANREFDAEVARLVAEFRA